MKSLYHPTRHGKHAVICRTVASDILDAIRNPRTKKPVAKYRNGFTSAELRNDGVDIPAGAMTLLNRRGWIVKIYDTQEITKTHLWVMTDEAVQFLDEIRNNNEPGANE